MAGQRQLPREEIHREVHDQSTMARRAIAHCVGSVEGGKITNLSAVEARISSA